MFDIIIIIAAAGQPLSRAHEWIKQIITKHTKTSPNNAAEKIAPIDKNRQLYRIICTRRTRRRLYMLVCDNRNVQCVAFDFGLASVWLYAAALLIEKGRNKKTNKQTTHFE